ncbi:MAG: MFS transporter [Cyclobacteriaceae bacterium]|nr:MFS transporter [Cyclobacteriaceae bacterium]
MKQLISRTVWTLSLVSLFTDISSEMLYPVMPAFLKSIGFSVILIGLLEGLAEATAGLSKGYFGELSDRQRRRLPFVQLGYTLSAISKPLMAVTVFLLWIFIARTLDRFGKGIRTGARDAILSAEATATTKARVFGFHRALDTTGAFLGPTVALLFLYFYPGHYQTLFLLAFVPGITSALLTLLLKEPTRSSALSIEENKSSVPFFSFLRYWRVAPSSYRKVAGGLLVFTLINSSDVFLLLKAKEVGLTDLQVIGVYIFYNLVYAAFAYPAGMLADRWGLRKTLAVGLSIFAFVYSGMAFTGGVWWIGFLFFLYGAYAACTEGISKAWLTNIAEQKDTATAIGTYTALQSICTLIASTTAGVIWYSLGDATLFIFTGMAAFLVACYFVAMKV